MGKKKRRQTRGYPVAILIGLESKDILIWIAYSKRVKFIKILRSKKKYTFMEKSQKYKYFEEVIDVIRPFIREGLRIIILINPIKKKYSEDFINHIKSHQKWMFQEKNPNSVIFKSISGSIQNHDEATAFIQSKHYFEAIKTAEVDEGGRIIANLKKRLNNPKEGLVLYTLIDIEELIYRGGKKKKNYKPLKLYPEYIILTTNYINNNPQKNRVYQLLQIIRNRGIKTKIIDNENPAGSLLESFGGIVCFLKVKSDYERQLGEEIIKGKK